MNKCHLDESLPVTRRAGPSNSSPVFFECQVSGCRQREHASPEALSQHVRDIHLRPLRETCPMDDCGASFPAVQGVIQHLASAHHTPLSALKSALPSVPVSLPPLPPLPVPTVVPTWRFLTPLMRKPAFTRPYVPPQPKDPLKTQFDDIRYPHEDLDDGALNTDSDPDWVDPSPGPNFDLSESDDDQCRDKGKGKGKENGVTYTHGRKIRDLGVFWELRPIAEPDGVQYAAPATAQLHEYKQRHGKEKERVDWERREILYPAFKARFMREHPQAHLLDESKDEDESGSSVEEYISSECQEDSSDEDGDEPPLSAALSASQNSSRQSSSRPQAGRRRRKKGW
ncbi:hypothetical protein EXIGLDRAFT_44529 [Exidia glandulosa HHB12029]|uniref:C2H2-type domain-containing protein n=1 Tax=Exidia glandulosa HHB12029 TaxID=1314781 RepID=A0A165IHI1_EXIGL|nr:hypothetical protein EXIGLDRAFT_44529 [Exidia glandulosa HHB12029]